MSEQNPAKHTDSAYAQDLQIAADLARAGVPVFVATPKQEPGVFHLPKEWQHTEANAAVVDDWRPGYALCAVMGHVFDVIDVDPRNGGDIAALNGAIPHIYAIVRTPRGGKHYWIKALGLAKAQSIRPGVDYQGGKPDGSGRSFVYLPPTFRPGEQTNPDGTPMLASYLWETRPGGAGAMNLWGDTTGAALAGQIPKWLAERRTSGGVPLTESAGAVQTSGVVARLPEFLASGIPSGQQHDVIRDLVWYLVGQENHENVIHGLIGSILEKSPQDLADPWTPQQIHELILSTKTKYFATHTGREVDENRKIMLGMLYGKEDAEKINKEYKRLSVRDTAQVLLESEKAEKNWKPIKTELLDTSIQDTITKDIEPTEWIFQDVAGVGHNILVVAKYKAGKTSLLVNVIKALADGYPLFGRFNVNPSVYDMNFFMWNCEMTRGMYRDYISPLGISNNFKGQALHLRGETVPFMKSDRVYKDVVERLGEFGTNIWILDTWRAICGWNGIDPIDNAAVEEVLQVIDHIKADAGVQTLFLTSHTPKYTMPGEEISALGAQGLMGWADCFWTLSRDDDDKNIRYLSSEGRYEFSLEPTRINYDQSTHLITLSDERKEDRKQQVKRDKERKTAYDVMRAILEYVKENPDVNTTNIKEHMKDTLGLGHIKTNSYLKLMLAGDAPCLRRDEAVSPMKYRVTGAALPVLP